MHTTPLDYRKKLKPLCERGLQEMLKRTCNILAHLKIPMLRFLLCLYRECFAMIKK